MKKTSVKSKIYGIISMLFVMFFLYSCSSGSSSGGSSDDDGIEYFFLPGGSMAAGCEHSVALKSDGTVWAWGGNEYGQLGEGDTSFESPKPIQIAGISNVTSLASGHYHIAALKSDGTVLTWGYNSFGQLGNGTTTDSTAPVQVPNLTGVSMIACGYEHTAALKNDGTVWAWGRYDYDVSHKETTNDRHSPVQVSYIITDVQKIFSGYGHLFALCSDNTVWAWGDNMVGQLGDGTTTYQTDPVQVLGVDSIGYLSDVKEISGGFLHTLALKNDGTVLAWGYNEVGQLGIGSLTENYIRWPVEVPGLSGIVSVAAGASGEHSLALKSDGTVWAWGYNKDGQLGDGSNTDRSSPVQVKGPGGTGFLTEVVSISAGHRHSLAIKSDGTVWAWGDNDIYQLGNGTYMDSNTPIQVQR
jgi:alpha-tubulin suppressor-like RCC1 family protein